MAVIRIEVPSDSIDLVIHVDDQLVYQPVSEFNTGIRQGNASNDDRNLASFFSFEDGRAGIGTRIGDVREDVDKLYDSDGAIAFQFNQLIKSPKSTLNLELSAASNLHVPRPIETDYFTPGTLELVFGTDITLRKATTSMGSVTAHGILSKNMREIAEYISPVDGDRFIFGGTEDTTSVAEYGKNTADMTVSTGLTLQSFVEFDGKFFGAGAGELWWTIDPEDQWFAVAGNWPVEWKFLGVFAFGQTYLPYAITNPYDAKPSRLIVVDVDGGRIFPVRLGINQLTRAIGFKSEIALIADGGKDIFIYEPFQRTLRDLDWRANSRSGFDATERGALAKDLIEHRKGLMAVAQIQTSNTSIQLFMFRGTGWHPYGSPITVSAVDYDVLPGSVYIADSEKFFIFAHDKTNTDVDIYSINWEDEPFTPNIAQTYDFENADQATIVPWFNMGFSDLPGIALALRCGGWFDATHTILIEYQIDFNETTWTTLGTYPGTVPSDPEITNRVTPVAGTDTLTFGTGLHGVAFKWIRFRITLKASATHSKSANAYPLTFQFIKRPNLRDQVRFAVDWQRTQAANPDLPNFTIKDLVNTIRDIYNATTQPKITINGEVTYSVITSYPRVPVLGPSIHRVTGDVDYESAVLVLTAAELL